MGYTSEQVAIIEKLENGLNYWNQSDSDREILRFLDETGIACPRVNTAPGRYVLTQTGKQVLSDIRRARLAAEIQTRKELDALLAEESRRQEQMQREQDAKQEQLSRIAADKAERHSEKKADRQFQVFLAFLQAFLTFVTGLLVEHFLGIVDLIAALFR